MVRELLWLFRLTTPATLNLLRNLKFPLFAFLTPKGLMRKTREKVLAGKACWTEDGAYLNSASDETGIDINGLNKKEGITKVVAWLEEKGIGQATTNFKLRDWLFSRQRYWGEPFPVIHWEDGDISLVEDDLPVTLPDMEKV